MDMVYNDEDKDEDGDVIVHSRRCYKCFNL